MQHQKVLDRYIIFVYNFKTMVKSLRKLELPQTFLEKFEIP